MNDRPKAAPDGEPTLPAKAREGTSKSKITDVKITDVQDPLIAGDAGKRRETSEPDVGEAGEVRRKKDEVDLLH